MIARLALLAAAFAAAAPVGAAPRPWTAVARPATSGGMLVGNPAARVKLVEYVSYTCPHCAHFAAESREGLKALVRSGSTSVEVRSQVHDKIDLAAATLVRCAGPAVFPALNEALFARQEEWLGRAIEWDRANGGRLSLYPQAAQLRALADGAGLVAMATAAGMPAATAEACFANDAALRQTLAASAATAKVGGTPAFEINGRLVENVGWAELQPMLRAAGAR